MHERDERHYETEIYRLKGELLLTQEGERRKERESGGVFCQALALAHQRQSEIFRAPGSNEFVSPVAATGQTSCSPQQLLAEIYAWFTEGFTTPDLQEAKALLDVLT